MDRQREHGFTLIELMIGLVIGLLLLAGIISLFSQTQKSSRQNELIAGVQDNARFALSVLADDVRATGFAGTILNPADIVPHPDLPALGNDDCGTSAETTWAYQLDPTAQVLSTEDPATIVAAHKCLPSSNLPASSDVLAVKRTLGDPKPSGSTLVANRVYLRSNGAIGCFWYNTGTPPAAAAGCPASDYDDWMYMTNVYYIQDDGTVPQLCRYALGAGPAMTQQCLAQGIEYFHIEWGVDTDADADGIVNVYDPAPADMTRVVSARIYVLARSTDEVQDKSAVKKDYRLGSVVLTREDRHFRRVYTTTVLLRNTVNRAKLL